MIKYFSFISAYQSISLLFHFILYFGFELVLFVLKMTVLEVNEINNKVVK